MSGIGSSDQGIVHPNWALLFDRLKRSGLPGLSFEARTELVHWWLTGLAGDLGGEYRAYRDRDLWLVSDRPAPINRWLLDRMETVRAVLRSSLGNHPAFDDRWPFVVIYLSELDDFYTYTQHFYPETATGVAAYGGVMLGRGYSHVALPHRRLSFTSGTLAHELTHLVFSRSDLPRWLDEGLACHFEAIGSGRGNRAQHLDDAPDHRAYWTEASIQHFWSGKSFSFADDGQRLSYSLATLLTRRLMEEGPLFGALLQEAKAIDAGQTASLGVFGLCLGHIVSALLGPGLWRPVRKLMVESSRRFGPKRDGAPPN